MQKAQQQVPATDQQDTPADRWGSSDLALLAFAILAVFAYILI